MILTTTPSIEGKTISDYRGIVTGEAILGANLFRDFFAGACGTSSEAVPHPTRKNYTKLARSR